MIYLRVSPLEIGLPREKPLVSYYDWGSEDGLAADSTAWHGI